MDYYLCAKGLSPRDVRLPQRGEFVVALGNAAAHRNCATRGSDISRVCRMARIGFRPDDYSDPVRA